MKRQPKLERRKKKEEKEKEEETEDETKEETKQSEWEEIYTQKHIEFHFFRFQTVFKLTLVFRSFKCFNVFSNAFISRSARRILPSNSSPSRCNSSLFCAA